MGFQICFYCKWINSFLVWDASPFVAVSSSQCLDMTVGKIENGLERGFVKHLITVTQHLLVTHWRWHTMAGLEHHYIITITVKMPTLIVYKSTDNKNGIRCNTRFLNGK